MTGKTCCIKGRVAHIIYIANHFVLLCTPMPLRHRPYMKLYELGLQKSCYKVANRFSDQDMRLAGNRTCAILRAPWWDIVKGTTPSILSRKTVTVYNRAGTDMVEKRNPLRRYCFSVGTQYKAAKLLTQTSSSRCRALT